MECEELIVINKRKNNLTFCTHKSRFSTVAFHFITFNTTNYLTRIFIGIWIALIPDRFMSSGLTCLDMVKLYIN